MYNGDTERISTRITRHDPNDCYLPLNGSDLLTEETLLTRVHL